MPWLIRDESAQASCRDRIQREPCVRRLAFLRPEEAAVIRAYWACDLRRRLLAGLRTVLSLAPMDSVACCQKRAEYQQLLQESRQLGRKPTKALARRIGSHHKSPSTIFLDFQRNLPAQRPGPTVLCNAANACYLLAFRTNLLLLLRILVKLAFP